MTDLMDQLAELDRCPTCGGTKEEPGDLILTDALGRYRRPWPGHLPR